MCLDSLLIFSLLRFKFMLNLTGLIRPNLQSPVILDILYKAVQIENSVMSNRIPFPNT